MINSPFNKDTLVSCLGPSHAVWARVRGPWGGGRRCWTSVCPAPPRAAASLCWRCSPPSGASAAPAGTGGEACRRAAGQRPAPTTETDGDAPHLRIQKQTQKVDCALVHVKKFYCEKSNIGAFCAKSLSHRHGGRRMIGVHCVAWAWYFYGEAHTMWASKERVQVLQVRSQFSGFRRFGHNKFVSVAIILLFCCVVISCYILCAMRALYWFENSWADFWKKYRVGSIWNGDLNAWKFPACLLLYSDSLVQYHRAAAVRQFSFVQRLPLRLATGENQGKSTNFMFWYLKCNLFMLNCD